MEIRVTHQGRLLHEIEITPDAQVHVRSFQPTAEQGGPPPAAQYVWGSQAAMGPPPAAQYVWGSQAAMGPPPAAQYVWGMMGPPPAAQYVWGATNDRPGGVAQRAIAVDCPSSPGAARPGVPMGEKVTEALLGSPATK
jgi:hypothetical protein